MTTQEERAKAFAEKWRAYDGKDKNEPYTSPQLRQEQANRNACTRCGHALVVHRRDLGPCETCECANFAFITMASQPPKYRVTVEFTEADMDRLHKSGQSLEWFGAKAAHEVYEGNFEEVS